MSNRSEVACEDATKAVGGTPLVYLRKVTEGLNAKIGIKLEYMNPSCSVKDRASVSMIEDAEKRGLITPGKTVLVEATSGNLGIGLAFVARVKGYKLILLMPQPMSIERRSIIKAYGAEVYITDPSIIGRKLMEHARTLAESIPNGFFISQFENPANPLAHYRTTGPEIWKQTDGKVDIIVFGVGSGGTVTGTGRFLKEQNPNIKVYAAEPDESAVLNGECAGPHKIAGTGAGFKTDILDLGIVESEFIRVKSDDALVMARRLALEEGILGGISAGGNVVAAIELAKRPENAGKIIVTNASSFGERYLSSELYDAVKKEAERLEPFTLEEAIEAGKKYASN